jgi:type IV pilus assembly protein PilM
MSAFANLLQDPPPTHAFELSEEGLAFAPVSEPARAAFARFEPGVLLVSPMHDNIQQPQVLLDHIQSLAPANGHRKRRAAVILPDYCSRVAVLDFDTFPSDLGEQQALVRFRLKKSVPFEVDTAVVSYVEQSRSTHEKTGAKVEILAAVISSEIVAQYEAPFRAAGFHPGLVTTSSLAALNLLAPDGISLLVKLSGRVLSVLVLQEEAVNLARCIEMEGGRLEDIESVLHPTIAYVEDELKARPKQIWLAGFGADAEQLAPRWENEWGVAVQAIHSRFGAPGNGNTGLFGYLESVA